MVHLDTSFLIRALLKGSPEDAQLRKLLAAKRKLGMSSVAWADFLCGPVTTTQVDIAAQIVGERTPFADDDAQLSADLFNRTGRRRGSLADAMIAAAAINAGATLATSNVDDFVRFATYGLTLLD